MTKTLLTLLIFLIGIIPSLHSAPMNLGLDLPNIKLTDKEAYYLYTRVLQKHSVVSQQIKNTTSHLDLINKQLLALASFPYISQDDKRVVTLEETKLNLQTQLTNLNDQLIEINNKLATIVNGNPHASFHIYTINRTFILNPELKTKYPTITTPLIDQESDLKLNPTLNLAIPVGTGIY